MRLSFTRFQNKSTHGPDQDLYDARRWLNTTAAVHRGRQNQHEMKVTCSCFNHWDYIIHHYKYRKSKSLWNEPKIRIKHDRSHLYVLTSHSVFMPHDVFVQERRKKWTSIPQLLSVTAFWGDNWLVVMETSERREARRVNTSNPSPSNRTAPSCPDVWGLIWDLDSDREDIFQEWGTFWKHFGKV